MTGIIHLDDQDVQDLVAAIDLIQGLDSLTASEAERLANLKERLLKVEVNNSE